MRCLYLGCYWECWWCLCSIEDADVACKLFISFSQSKHLLKNPLFHSNLGPFPAQRPLVHLPYCDFFAEVPEPTLPCLRNEGWLFFIYGLCMKNPSLCSMLNTQYTLFNMTILCFLNFERKDTQFLCKPSISPVVHQNPLCQSAFGSWVLGSVGFLRQVAFYPTGGQNYVYPCSRMYFCIFVSKKVGLPLLLSYCILKEFILLKTLDDNCPWRGW